MVFVELLDKEYEDFVSSCRYGSMMQSIERANVRRAMNGYQVALLGVKNDKKKVVAAGLLMIKGKEGMIQLGPVLDFENEKIVRFYIENLVKWCKDNGLWSIDVLPPVLVSKRDIDGTKIWEDRQEKLFTIFKEYNFSHAGFTTKAGIKALRWMFVKDIEGMKDMREVELSFNASTRKKWHQTERELEIYILKDKNELGEWIKPVRESDARNHVKTRGMDYFEKIWDAFGERATFVEARVKETGELVSSELDFWYDNESIAFIAGTMEKMKAYNGITAIKGWQMQECLRRGIKRVNFYGLDGDFSDKNPLLRAKSGFRGVIEEYIGEFSLVFYPRRLAVMKLMQKIKRKLKSLGRC